VRIAKQVFIKDIQKRNLRRAIEDGNYKGLCDVKGSNKLISKLAKIEGDKYIVKGKEYTRNQIWEYIVRRMGLGDSPKMICETPGMPSLRTVVGWVNAYPEFRKEYRESQEVRGIVLAERALEEALDTVNKDDAPAQKIKVDTLKWMASKHNDQFAEKTIKEVKHDLSGMSKEMLQQQLKSALGANLDILKEIPGIQDIIDVIPE
jgi:hypothetical protein